MKKNKSLVAIMVIAIYIIAVAGFILSLTQETLAGRLAAKTRFENLVRETQQALNVNDVHSETFLNSFLVSLDNLSDIAGIELKDKTSILLTYPSDSVSNNNLSPSLVTPYSEDIYTSNGNPLTLKAEIYVLKPSSIFYKGRLAFLVIFAAALICLLYIIYINIYTDDEQKDEDSQEEKESLIEEDDEEDYSLRTPEIKQTKIKKIAVENIKDEIAEKPVITTKAEPEKEPEEDKDNEEDYLIMDVQDEDDSMDEESSLNEEPDMIDDYEEENEDFEEKNEDFEEENAPQEENIADDEEVQMKQPESAESIQEKNNHAVSNYTAPEKQSSSMISFGEEISERAQITAEEMAALQAEFKDDYSKNNNNDVVDEDIYEKYEVIYAHNDIVEEYKNIKTEFAEEHLAEPIQRTVAINEKQEINTEPKTVTETIIESMSSPVEQSTDEESVSESDSFNQKTEYHEESDTDDMDELELELDDDDEDNEIDSNKNNVFVQTEDIEECNAEQNQEHDNIISESISFDSAKTNTDKSYEAAPQKEDIFEHVTAEETTATSNSWNPTEIPTVNDIVPNEKTEHESDDEYSVQSAYDEIDASNNAFNQNEEETFSDVEFFDDFEDDPYFSDDEETAFVDNTEDTDTEQREDEYTPVLEISTPAAQNIEVAVQTQTASGLYSEKTGFCWESYMIPRLDNELSRATASNQDLSFFAIKISGINWESEEGKELSKSISETINFPDCIFENGEDGCTAIMPNVRIDESLATADALYSNIADILDKYDSADNHSIGIGISARSLRIISGERLSNEASEALNHALQDKESPIVAFKVNPQKYRNFLAAQAAEEEARQKEG